MEGGGHNSDNRNMNQALNTGHYTVPGVPIIHYNPLNLSLGLSCPVQAFNDFQESMAAKDPEAGGSRGISFGGSASSTVPAEGFAAYGQSEVAFPMTIPDFSSVPMTVWTPLVPDYSYGESSGNSGWDTIPTQNLLQFDQYAAAQPMQEPQQMYFNDEFMMHMNSAFSTESYGWRSSTGDYQEVMFNTHSNNTTMLEGIPDLNNPVTEPQPLPVPADFGHGAQFFRHEYEDQAYGMIDEDGLWLNNRGIAADAASIGQIFWEAPTLEMIAEMVHQYHAMYSQPDSLTNPNYDPAERDRFINEINIGIANAYRAGIVRPQEIHALPTPMPIHFVEDSYYADPPLGDQNDNQYDDDDEDEIDSLEEFDGSLGISEVLIESNVNRCKYEPPAIVPADESGRDQCCICQLEYDEGADIGKLACNHEYHYECIKKWLLVKNCCPYCQSKAA